MIIMIEPFEIMPNELIKIEEQIAETTRFLKPQFTTCVGAMNVLWKKWNLDLSLFGGCLKINKKDLPNGGETMVIYHGRIRKTSRRSC